MSVIICRANGISNQAECIHHTIFKDAARNPGQQYLYLVPEQATLQVERELIAAHPAHAIGNIQVVSFTSLAYDVLDELEVGLTHMLDDVGKSMILRRIAEEMKQKLPAFGRNLSKQGFIEELKGAVNELAMSGVRADHMEQILQSISGHTMLQRKMEDIYYLYREFSRQLGDKYMTAEELLWILTKHVGESKRLKNSRIILYGFNSFKQYQYQVLEELIAVCEGMIVLVTAGGTDPELFGMAQGMVKTIVSLAQKHGVACKAWQPRSLRELEVVPEIRHLERHLFRYPAGVWEDEPQHLKLVCAKNPSDEIAYVLREMMRLVREESYRYSDMAVITGDLSVYGSTVTAAFEKAGIPYFLDEKKKLENNPLAELIEQLLDVLEENMSYGSVMALLRNPLYPIEQEKADILDNYLVASGIEGTKRWNEVWSWPYGNTSSERLNEINEIRTEICEQLAGIQEIWKGSKTAESGRSKVLNVQDGIEALVHFLQEIEAEQQLENWMEQFAEQGDFIRQSEYRQAFQKVLDLFDQIVQLMGEDELKPQLLIDTLHSGFEGLKVGFIPVTFDRVVVGDIARTRLNRVKALFLIGANDKVLPKETPQGGILNDYDRETLKEAGMALLPTAKEEAFFQQEYLYLTMTKASEKLVVSYSMSSREGKELRPAYLISALKRLFPKLEAQNAENGFEGLNRIIQKEDGFELLISGLRAYLDGEDSDWWRPLYGYYMMHKEYAGRLSSMKDGLFYSYQTEKLDEKIAKRLFEAGKENHVTRIEKYASCAYAHFLTYGLQLKPRKEHELKAADYGTVFHQAISGFFRRMKEEQIDWRTMEAADRTRLAAESVKDAMQLYGNPVFESSARNQYAANRITRMTDRTVWALGEQWKEGEYQTIFHEFVFSEAHGNAIHLPLKDGLTLALQGRIDRIDIGEKDGCVYVKVIDYKSGQTQFDLGRVYHGLQLQLLLYLEAVMEMERKRFPDKTIIPAGIYYYNMKDPLVNAMGETQDNVDEMKLKELRMNGLTNSDMTAVSMIDPQGGSVVKGLEKKKDGSLKATAMAATGSQFAVLQKYVKEKTSNLAGAMYDGEISANPCEYAGTASCEYCEYQSICSFELRTEGCAYRRLPKMKKEQIWEEIERINDGKEER